MSQHRFQQTLTSMPSLVQRRINVMERACANRNDIEQWRQPQEHRRVTKG